jgi:hypothetical protein
MTLRGYYDRHYQHSTKHTPQQRAYLTLLNAGEWLRSERGQYSFGTVVLLTAADADAVDILAACREQIASEHTRTA